MQWFHLCFCRHSINLRTTRGTCGYRKAIAAANGKSKVGLTRVMAKLEKMRMVEILKCNSMVDSSLVEVDCNKSRAAGVDAADGGWWLREEDVYGDRSLRRSKMD
ncbi:hypothetical protein K1719_036250 [Acacia pycnantha]|nr:hypothetical protein K1719_036250 [Acacia pycnantha]